MKGFELNEKGDVIINRDISMVYGNNLLRQTVETLLGTNLGEWFLNENEGIDHRAMITKNPNFDLIQTEIQRGLLQVDNTMWITEYDYFVNGRKLTIHFKARNETGEEIEANQTFS